VLPLVPREKNIAVFLSSSSTSWRKGVPSPPHLPENLLRTLTMDAMHLSIKERSLYWRTRDKVRFALEGDGNTKFCHASATCKLRCNSIPALVVDGVGTSDHHGKASILHSYYSNLLGSVTPTSWRFDLSSLYPDALPLRGSLSAPFTPEDVKNALSTMNKLSLACSRRFMMAPSTLAG
jgi:hypothetical protein